MTSVPRPRRGHRGAPRRSGPGDLVFEPGARRVRVPPGVTLFDAASWNGIAIDSTCGGHGTCKKCKVQVSTAAACAVRAGCPRVHRGRAGSGWRLACRAWPVADTRITMCRRWSPGRRPRPSASAGRSSCARQRRSGTWSWRSRRWPTSVTDVERCRGALTTWSCGSTWRAAHPRPGARAGGLQGDRGDRRRRADRRDSRGTPRRAGRASCSRPRHHHGVAAICSTCPLGPRHAGGVRASMLNKQPLSVADVITGSARPTPEPGGPRPVAFPGAARRSRD